MRSTRRGALDDGESRFKAGDEALMGDLRSVSDFPKFTPYERAIQGLGPCCGHAGVRSWWEESFEVLPEVQEVRDLGDRTLVRGRLHGQGAGSGAPFERHLWEIVQ
jgi:hypothetical protein